MKKKSEANSISFECFVFLSEIIDSKEINSTKAKNLTLFIINIEEVICEFLIGIEPNTDIKMCI